MLEQHSLSTLFDAVPTEVWEEQLGGKVPTIADGEDYFQWASTLTAVMNAKDRFVMVSLGAHFGAPLINAVNTLRQINPIPYYLVGVEANPHTYEDMKLRFIENNIEPNDHWLLNSAISHNTLPVIFSTSVENAGTNQVVYLDQGAHEPLKELYTLIIDENLEKQCLYSLLVSASTGIGAKLEVAEGEEEIQAVLRYISTITLTDVLHPLPIVDYLEADIQRSEIHVFPLAIGVLNKKVKSIHLGTHDDDDHKTLCKMFKKNNWNIVIDLLPHQEYPDFTTCDGVLFMQNMGLMGGV